jgi:two-component system response regulator DegU
LEDIGIMKPITVVIAVGEKAPRIACLQVLQSRKEMRVVAEARSGLDVIAVAAKFKPRIILLDLNVSLGRGIELLSALRLKSPGSKVILLVGRTSEARILEALSGGALGYLEEKALHTFLPKAIRVVDAGEAWVPRKFVAKIISRLARLTTVPHSAIA